MKLNSNLPIPIHFRDNQLWTTSTSVAEKFRKRHTNVLRIIEDLECSHEFKESNFSPTSYTDKGNRSYPMYDLTRDGFTLLVMGFTGKEAMRWKETYISAFNAMEKKLFRTIPNSQEVPKTLTPIVKEFRLIMKTAMDLGLDRKNAGIRANDTARKITGHDLLDLMEIRQEEIPTAQPAPEQPQRQDMAAEFFAALKDLSDESRRRCLELREHQVVVRLPVALEILLAAGRQFPASRLRSSLKAHPALIKSNVTCRTQGNDKLQVFKGWVFTPAILTRPDMM
jgi:Rha family phage regulatory protein